MVLIPEIPIEEGKMATITAEVLVASILMQPVIWYWAAWLRRRKLAELSQVKKMLQDVDVEDAKLEGINNENL